MDLNSSSSSSSSPSEDLYYLIQPIKTRKLRTLQQRIDADYFTDDEFKNRFRFTKDSVEYIMNLISEDLNMDARGSPLNPRQQIMITLRYYATGCFQTVAGDLIGVSQSTACRIVHKVSRSIARLSKRFIKMPMTTEEIVSAKKEFYHFDYTIPFTYDIRREKI